MYAKITEPRVRIFMPLSTRTRIQTQAKKEGKTMIQWVSKLLDDYEKKLTSTEVKA
jgi:hypothetical protein